MKKQSISLALAPLLLAVSSTSAWASASCAQVIQICRSPASEDACVMLLAGLVNGRAVGFERGMDYTMQVMNVHPLDQVQPRAAALDQGLDRAICVTEGPGVSGADMRATVLRNLKPDSPGCEVSSAEGVLKVFEVAYPCKGLAGYLGAGPRAPLSEAEAKKMIEGYNKKK